MHRTKRVDCLDSLIRLDEIRSVTSLITKAPHYNGRMIVITLNHSHNTLDMSMFKVRIVRKGFLAITHSVRLHICLIHNIYAIAVTKRIPERVIRIVTCADGIDVELLHDPDITNHILLAHDISLIWVHLMSVHTLDEHRLTIDLKIDTLNAYVAEADLDISPLCLALLIICCKSEGIEPRLFCRPLLDLRNSERICQHIVSSL